MPIILGRHFLTMTRAPICVDKEKRTMMVDNGKVVPKLFHSMNSKCMQCFSIDVYRFINYEFQKPQPKDALKAILDTGQPYYGKYQ